MSLSIGDINLHTHSAPAMQYTNHDHVHSADTETHQATESQPNSSCISARLKNASAIRKNSPLSLSFLFPVVGDNVTILGPGKLTI
jgi:hypothetical protein